MLNLIETRCENLFALLENIHGNIISLNLNNTYFISCIEKVSSIILYSTIYNESLQAKEDELQVLLINLNQNFNISYNSENYKSLQALVTKITYIIVESEKLKRKRQIEKYKKENDKL